VSLLEVDEDRDILTNRVLAAIAQNPTVHTLSVSGENVLQPASFAKFLDTARFIGELEVDVWSFNPDHPDRERLAASFGRNQTLRTLWLKDRRGQAGDNGIGELVLWHLCSNVHELRFLALCFGLGARITQFQALASMLASTRTLSHLYLCRYTFDVESTTVVLTALKSNRTLKCLELMYCSMEQAALDLWTRFLQSGDSCIQTLQLAPNASFGGRRANAFDSDAIGIALLRMVIRSSVRILALRKDFHGRVPRFAPLFVGLTKNEAMVRLRRLAIGCLDETIAAALSQFLAQSSCLQGLAIVSLIEPEYARLLLSGIRRNGSVHAFTWNAPLYSAVEMDAELLKLVAAYCERNKKIPMLLAKSHDFTDSTDAADMDTASSIAPCLVPSLFLVAQHAARMAGNNMLIGLLGVLGGDVIGPPQIVLAMKRSNDSTTSPL
jgi:hypothetical protein